MSEETWVEQQKINSKTSCGISVEEKEDKQKKRKAHVNPFATIFVFKYTNFVVINSENNEVFGKLVLSLTSLHLECKLARDCDRRF